jgi:hypothetical protein
VAIAMANVDHGSEPARRPSSAARPADIPASKSFCAVVECQVRIAPGSRFAALITRRAADAAGRVEPSRWIVVACSGEHLQLLIDRLA